MGCALSLDEMSKTKVGRTKRLACRFVDTAADVQRNVTVLAQLGHAVRVEFLQQSRDRTAIRP